MGLRIELKISHWINYRPSCHDIYLFFDNHDQCGYIDDVYYADSHIVMYTNLCKELKRMECLTVCTRTRINALL
jgi:hypothetical protein